VKTSIFSDVMPSGLEGSNDVAEEPAASFRLEDSAMLEKL